MWYTNLMNTLLEDIWNDSTYLRGVTVRNALGYTYAWHKRPDADGYIYMSISKDGEQYARIIIPAEHADTAYGALVNSNNDVNALPASAQVDYFNL